jgi:hypothetical protein
MVSFQGCFAGFSVKVKAPPNTGDSVDDPIYDAFEDLGLADVIHDAVSAKLLDGGREFDEFEIEVEEE